MKLNFLLSGLLCCPLIMFAQKPAIDTNAINTWTRVENKAISNDGNYVSYVIDNLPLGRETLVIQSIDGKWKKEIAGASSAVFSENSHSIIYVQPETGLIKQTLGSSNAAETIAEEVTSFQLKGEHGKEWLVFQKLKSDKSLVLVEMNSGKRKSYPGILSFNFNSESGLLALIATTEARDIQEVRLVNIWNDVQQIIGKGNNLSNPVFDAAGKQFAFLADGSIRYYKTGMLESIELVNKNAAGDVTAFGITADKWGFSNDGNFLFYDVKEIYPTADKRKGVAVDVWNYQDPVLQSVQLKKRRGSSYLHNVNIATGKITRLIQENEAIITAGGLDLFRQKKMLVERREADINEERWNEKSKQTLYLVEAETGERKTIIGKTSRRISSVQLSPGGGFIIYYDPEKEDYFSYNIKTGKKINITAAIVTDRGAIPLNNLYAQKNRRFMNRGIAGWLPGDSSVLIYSCHDIWKVDVRGGKKPVNLTGYYGNKNQTIFSLAFGDEDIVHDSDTIFLESFNYRNKNAGIYTLVLFPRAQLQKLFEGPYGFSKKNRSLNHFTPSFAGYFTKAKNRNAWIVERSESTGSPNFYYTEDLKQYIPVSDVHPEKKYNWMTHELHTVPLTNGRSTQGILYKPENFNPKEKYPVIICYYEDLSNELNIFCDPEITGGIVNIAHFVSNGYLIFQPDILFKDGKSGESALQTVEAVARYLSALSYVNANSIGINGHSFGGYETNYIVTHSNMFRAAATGAGQISLLDEFAIGSEAPSASGYTKEITIEEGYHQLKLPLWENPDAYIKASPLFYLNKVTTPVLIFHNKNDGAVNWQAGVQMFVALRRQGKKAWLLQYDGENHIISSTNKRTAYDAETRFMQFFDHYLKDKPAPKWMTRGIPAKMKGIDTGLELDDEID